MQSQSGVPSGGNGATAAHDLFVLTDEQILEIQPENANAARPSSEAHSQIVIPSERSESRDRGDLNESSSSQNARHDSSTPSRSSTGTPVGMTESKSPTGNPEAEPPPWLAAQMKDPWSGEEARELWNGVQQTRQEAAAYRAAFATPEDARALKELYPGGVNEARAAADRARLLDQIDQAYFGVTGGTPEQTSAARADLAQRMLREDPAAFREMVFAGLRALEEAEKGSAGSASAAILPRLAQVFAASRQNDQAGVGATLASPAASAARNAAGMASSATTGTPTVAAPNSVVGAQHAAPPTGTPATSEAHVAAYAAFEKAANEDLERSVGATIAHTLQQALPNLERMSNASSVGAQHAAPLQERLGAAVRQDIEAALKGDRQLGEQISQILAARRFDNETRAQVVRLIDDRARQLVPSAAKRVLNDWTQTTLATHRGNTTRAGAASTRREVEPASSDSGRAFLAANSPRTSQTRAAADPNRSVTRPDARRVDYRKLSDEQILEL